MNTQWTCPDRKKIQYLPTILAYASRAPSSRQHTEQFTLSERGAAASHGELFCLLNLSLRKSNLLHQTQRLVSPERPNYSGWICTRSKSPTGVLQRARHWKTSLTGKINSTADAIPAAPYSSAFSCWQTAALALIWARPFNRTAW